MLGNYKPADLLIIDEKIPEKVRQRTINGGGTEPYKVSWCRCDWFVVLLPIDSQGHLKPNC